MAELRGELGIDHLREAAEKVDCPAATDEPMLAIPPVPCTTGGTADPTPAPPQDPLIALMQASVAADAELAAATDAESQAAGRKSTALAASTSASNAFAAEWTKRHPLPSPVVPTPVPSPVPVSPVTSILVVSSPASCPPCKLLEPVLNGLKAGGMPITVVDSADPAAAQWKATAIPTLVMLVNSREQSRAVGYFDAAAISDWYDRTRSWAAIKFPPPKVSDEVPAPPTRSKP